MAEVAWPAAIAFLTDSAKLSGVDMVLVVMALLSLLVSRHTCRLYFNADED